MELKALSQELISAAIEAVSPERIVPGALMSERIEGNVHVLSVGKAGARCALAAKEVLRDRIIRGLVISPESCVLEGFQCIVSQHPLPDQGSLEAGQAALNLAKTVPPGDTLLVLLSGGASSLMVRPAQGFDLATLRKLNELMLNSGMSIQEINTVRRHISTVKGGRLALAVPQGARVLGLIISDVVGDTLEDIGSGPTAPDPTLRADAITVLKRTRIWNKMGHRFQELMWDLEETPKPDHPGFARVRNRVIGNNYLALSAVKQKAESLGYRAVIITDMMQGEASQLGLALGGVLKGIASGKSDLASQKLCLILGGETTVKVVGKGKGGRNQELALSAAMAVKNEKRVGLIAFSTDGIDGPTEAAGAFVDGKTCVLAEDNGILPEKYLQSNDANTFFKKMDHLLITGPTGTNVADVVILVSDPDL